MDPLVIIATPNICWLNPDVEYPQTPDDIAEEAELCYINGATILHTHAEGNWKRTIAAVRNRTPIVVQCGMSSQLIPERMDIFKNNGDMISIILNHHDEAFVGVDFNVLHPKAELEEYIRLCKIYNVIPEWEVWHSGSVWNLNYLIQRNLISPPYVTTLYLYRRRLMPSGCVCNVSIMGKGQHEILVAAITNGDNVRVGTEDYPYDQEGNIVTTHELVKEVAEMAHALGRRLATPEETRKMIGL
jgi:3-keto-5-aminohexanoate cleavage enzyme